MAGRDHPLLSRRLIPLVVMVVLAGACGGSDATSGSTAPAASETTAQNGVESTAQNGVESTAQDGVESTAQNSSEAAAETTATVEELFPDVVDASATRADDGTWTFSATLSSPYDTPERYADAWRVIGPDGSEYGRRELLHDHADEQPFTRSESGIVIPEGIEVVTVQGRDQVSGWGGATVEVALTD